MEKNNTNLKIIKKAFICSDKYRGYIFNDIFATTANKAKYLHVKSGFDDATYISTVCYRNRKNDIVDYDGEHISRNEAIKKNKLKERRKLFDEQKLNYSDKFCYIYSGQWDLYWKSNSSGYTDSKETAGIYSVVDAYNIVYSCGIEKDLYLIII